MGIWRKFTIPHNIQVDIEFQYIGKYLPNAKGKHFELNWLTDFGEKEGTYSSIENNVFRNSPFDWIKGQKNAKVTHNPTQDKARWNTYSGIVSEDDDLVDDFVFEEV